MLKISYADCLRLSSVISAQFVLEMCVKPEIVKNSRKFPIFGVQGCEVLYERNRLKTCMRWTASTTKSSADRMQFISSAKFEDHLLCERSISTHAAIQSTASTSAVYTQHVLYEGRSINKSQNGAIPLILKIGKIRNIRFVGNLTLNIQKKKFFGWRRHYCDVIWSQNSLSEYYLLHQFSVITHNW